MFTKRQRVEDIILQILKNGAEDTLVLVEKIKKVRTGTSKQAVYKSLKNLKENEIVVQSRGTVALSEVWLKKLIHFVEQAKRNYNEQSPSIDFLALKQGEKITYSFRTFEATDMFWAHAFGVLFEITPVDLPILVFDPHEWFLIARPESEAFLFEQFKKVGKKLFVIAGGTDPLDKFVAKYFDNMSSYYFATKEKIFAKRNYYVNVFDSFVLEAWLDAKTTELIDTFYSETPSLDDKGKQKLLEIIKRKGKNKLVISYNSRKADAIRSKFRKYF